MSDKKPKTVDYASIKTDEKTVFNRKDGEPKEKEEVTPILGYSAEVRKKGFLKRVGDTLLGKDGIFGYLYTEIVIPAIKTIIVDSFTNGIHMAVYKDAARPTTTRTAGRYNSTRGGYTDYGARYRGSNAYSGGTIVRSSNVVEDYVIRDREEALDIIAAMHDAAATYGHCTLAYYYDLINVESSFTDNSYGWNEDDIIHTTITRVKDGWIINLPKPTTV